MGASARSEITLTVSTSYEVRAFTKTFLTKLAAADLDGPHNRSPQFFLRTFRLGN